MNSNHNKLDSKSSQNSIWATSDSNNKPSSKKRNKSFKNSQKFSNELPPSAGPVTSDELLKRQERSKKFSKETAPKRNWDKVVLRSRFQNSSSETNEFILLESREEQTSYFEHIQSKMTRLKSNNPNQNGDTWQDVVQNFRKLREALLGQDDNIDLFVLKVYQQSIDAILSAKSEGNSEKLLEEELAKATLVLGEKLYPTYLDKLDRKLSKAQWNELGTYYAYYLFYLIGYSNFHLNQALNKIIKPPHERLYTHPDCRLASKLCFSMNRLQYIPFFALLSLCDSSQRKLIQPASDVLRSKALRILIHSYLQLPVSQVLCNLGFNDVLELDNYIGTLPQAITSSRRCPHFSPDQLTILFRKK